MRLLLFFILFSTICFSQSKFQFGDSNIKTTIQLTISDSIISEEIVIENISKENIYFPKFDNNFSIYHYIINDNYYSYYGIMNSLNGSPTMNTQIQLTKIEPNNIFKFARGDIKIEKSINGFIFSLDYILENNKIDKNNTTSNISSKNYSNENKYLIFKIFIEK